VSQRVELTVFSASFVQFHFFRIAIISFSDFLSLLLNCLFFCLATKSQSKNILVFVEEINIECMIISVALIGFIIYGFSFGTSFVYIRGSGFISHLSQKFMLFI
jgi:hypothetical protein